MKKNKLAFVLGGNGVIGREIVQRLQQSGMKVIILDIKIDKKLLNDNVLFFNFDSSKFNTVEKKLNKLISKYKCPDIFINTSYPYSKEWGKITFENLKTTQLRKNVDMHMNSFAWTSLKIAQAMKKAKVKGSIVLINSIYGVLGQDKNLYRGTKIKPNPVYALIKGGLIGYAKNLSSYYGEYGIRINTIISGGIKGHVAGSKVLQSKKFVKNYINKTPLKRMGNPYDISSAVLFLSSDESSYITGTNVYVDGGWSAI